jgi:hypothetical protein
MIDLTGYSSSPYAKKDIKKFWKCTKLISKGVKGSSSFYYSRHPKANIGNYNEKDIVGISVNGKRFGRLKFDKQQIDEAIKANVCFVTDNPYDRNRDYNIGEREVADYLTKNGYKETNPGFWQKI